MGFQSEVLNVFIASPSDTSVQRDEIEMAIYNWNKEHAEDLKTILLPKRWETDIAPGYHPKNPQQIINEKLLKKSDLLIGVFWTKLGTPTSDFASGTLEEVSTFHSLGKDVMVYFVNENVSLATDFEEVKKVNEFKKQFRNNNLSFDYNKNRIVSDLLKYVRERSSVNSIEKVESQMEVKKNNVNLAKLIESNALIEAEYILLYFVLLTGNRSFGDRWMTEGTLEQIKEWEVKKLLEPFLSSNYGTVLSNLVDRNLVEATEYTSYGNPKLYTMPIEIFNDLRNLRNDLKNKIYEVTRNYSSVQF